MITGLAAIIGVGVCTASSASTVSPRAESISRLQRLITSNDLIALRDIGGYSGHFAVSPDGEWLAYQIQQADAARDNFLTTWFVVAVRPISQSPITLGDGGEVVLLGEEQGLTNGARASMKARWSPDSRWVAYRVKRDNQIQLWRSSRDGSIQEQLTNNAADVATFAWSTGGDKIFFEVGWSRNGKQRALEREGERGFLFDDRFPGASFPLPVFTEAAYSKELDNGHVSGVWIYDIATAEERPATVEEEATYRTLTATDSFPIQRNNRKVRIDAPFDRSGAVIAWLEDVESQSEGNQYDLYMSTEDDSGVRCKAPECHGLIKQLMWSDSGNEVYFIRLEGDKYFNTGLYGWNRETRKVREILNTKDWLTNCETAGSLIVCLHESATTPRKIVAIDPSVGSIQTVVDPNPQFRNYEFTRVEPIHWKESHSGATAGGHLVFPADYVAGERYPMIIVQYISRGFLRGGVGDEFPIHPLAANGFFVLSFDIPVNPNRATSGDIYDRERADWGDDIWERAASLSALENIVEELDARGLIDPERVGITGLSDGAETVWYAMIHSRHFAAAAASSGSWSPSWFYTLGNQAYRKGMYLRAAELRPPGAGGGDRWKRISAEFHAKSIDVPILVQVADSELLMSAASVNSLLDADKPIETYVYPNEYHIKWRPEHKLAVYERSIDWFNFWLRGVENTERKKLAQYSRWNKLRERHIANLEAVAKAYELPLPKNTESLK